MKKIIFSIAFLTTVMAQAVTMGGLYKLTSGDANCYGERSITVDFQEKVLNLDVGGMITEMNYCHRDRGDLSTLVDCNKDHFSGTDVTAEHTSYETTFGIPGSFSKYVDDYQFSADAKTLDLTSTASDSLGNRHYQCHYELLPNQ